MADSYSFLLYLLSIISLTSSQFPFSLNIPTPTKCITCPFNWPTTSHYGYAFDITNDATSQLVAFSTISINYDTYNSTQPSCNSGSGFSEAFTYQIHIYYRESNTDSWLQKKTEPGSNTQTVSLTEPPIILTTGQWYIGIRLSWKIVSQRCDFIMDGWDMSQPISPYPIPQLISTIPGTNEQIKFTNIVCLAGDISTNSAITFSENILPHFDIEFELYTFAPTAQPSLTPTTAIPTLQPSVSPTDVPTVTPTITPTNNPTQRPTNIPTVTPTISPTFNPSNIPTMSPSNKPTVTPTNMPTVFPTAFPTYDPTFVPTISPSNNPTFMPTKMPTIIPTNSPSQNTDIPTTSPTNNPSISPTKHTGNPTQTPSVTPTKYPTNIPSMSPTQNPSTNPSKTPTNTPSITPTMQPTLEPTHSPSFVTGYPSFSPTNAPTMSPTSIPTDIPSTDPTNEPTIHPTLPTHNPTNIPTISPTNNPTLTPTLTPSLAPSAAPSMSPTHAPSIRPTYEPTTSPSNAPSLSPSLSPSIAPSVSPSNTPTISPTMEPTFVPTYIPTYLPTFIPTNMPTVHPTTQPTFIPTYNPTQPPTNAPTQPPSVSPTHAPTTPPTHAPTPHCPAVYVTVTDANNKFNADHFDGLYTFIHGQYVNNRPKWEVPQMPMDKNIQYTGTNWIINGKNNGILSHPSNSQYPPDDDTSAKWYHNTVSGIFHVNIKCVHTFSPITAPTNAPTVPPTLSPTFSPSIAPTNVPTFDPTDEPTNDPTFDPTNEPSYDPTSDPSVNPTFMPTEYPSVDPTNIPTYFPTNAPSVTPTNAPTNAPSMAPTLSPTDMPIIGILPNATHVKMVFLWNVSKTIEYSAIKNDKMDVSNAMIEVAYNYYNATMQISDVFVYCKGRESYVHLDVFILCEYRYPGDVLLMESCQTLQKDASRFKWLVFTELSKLKSNLAVIDAELMIDRLPQNGDMFMFYGNEINIASAQLSEHGLMIRFEFEYLLIAMEYTHKVLECKDLFLDKTIKLFGNGHYCTWSTSTVLLVHLGFNHGLDFSIADTHTMYYQNSVFLNMPPVIIQTKLMPPSIIHTPNVIVSGSRHIGYCDHLKLNIGSTHGNIGKSLSYKWTVYFELFKFPEQGYESEFILTRAALQTFPVELLRVELYSENWLGGNNTKIIYVHYDNKRNVSSLEFEGGHIQYRSLFDSNVIVTPNGKPFMCYPKYNENNADYLRYSWQQYYTFPKNILQQTLLAWPKEECITNYPFYGVGMNRYIKPLWIDTFDFFSSFQGNFSGLTSMPCVYFKLTMSQFNKEDKFIGSVYDYVAIQFVLDLPIAYATHSVVHNMDSTHTHTHSVLTLSVYDFYEFSDLLIEEWIQNIYTLQWQCNVYDSKLKIYAKECSVNCAFDGLYNPSQIEKVFDYGCFDRTQDDIYKIAVNIKLNERFMNDTFVSSIVYIHTTIDSPIHHTSLNKLPNNAISSTQRNILGMNLVENDEISSVKWTCSDTNICPNNQSLSDSLWFFHSYTDTDSKTSQLIINPYNNGYDQMYDMFGCYIGTDDYKLNEGAIYDLQMIADNQYLLASVSLSTASGIRGEHCNLTATDTLFMPMITRFTIKCGEFTTSAATLRYNVLLINHNLPNDEGTWMNDQFMLSSVFEFILGAGNYSLRVIIQDSNGDRHCVSVPQKINIAIPITDEQYMHKIIRRGNQAIEKAVLESDHTLLIQNVLGLSNTLCCFNYDALIEYDIIIRRRLVSNLSYIEWNDMIINALNIHINMSDYIVNMNHFNEFFRYKVIISMYQHLLTNFHRSVFTEILKLLMDMSMDKIIALEINIKDMIAKLYKLMQVMPYQMLQRVFEWNFSEGMSYDLYSDLLSVINLMRKNRIDLNLLIEKASQSVENGNFIDLFDHTNITDHNMYIRTINDMIKDVHLIFSNQFIVGEAISWNRKRIQVEVTRSQTNYIDCGTLAALQLPSIAVINKIDCIALQYAVPPWISHRNDSEEIVSRSLQIDLYSVNESNRSQVRMDAIEFINECSPIVFTLPMISNRKINSSENVLKINATYNIPKCVYFEWDTQSWSSDGCWVVNYTHNETVCACSHLSSFSLAYDEFTPNISIVTTSENGPFEWEILLEDPVCWMFVVALILLLLLSLLCIPPINSIPLIARSNVILKAERDDMLSSSWIGAVVLLLRKKNKKCFGKFCNLYGLNLRNHHSLLAICCAMQGMNVTTMNLLLTFMSYITTVMILSAIYYSHLTPDISHINEISYSISISFIALIPVLLFRYFLKNAKPTLESSSYYLTVQEKNNGVTDTIDMATDCIPLVNEDHSVSYSSLTGAGYKSSSANNNHKTDEDMHDINDTYEAYEAHNVTELVSDSSTPMIIPGAEWKCNRCKKLNDSDYQFCGYCSHKRLSFVTEATYEDSEFSLTQPGSAVFDGKTTHKPAKTVITLEKWDEMAEFDEMNDEYSHNAYPAQPSMNAPMPPPPSKNNAKKKKRSHFYNISDSSEIGNKYEYLGIAPNHNKQQSSVMSSVFDDDIDSDSIVLTEDESDCDSYNKFTKQQINAKDNHTQYKNMKTESAMTNAIKKPWSMSSASPTLSASHTTNTTLGTNIDDLNTIGTMSSYGFSLKLKNRTHTHNTHNTHNNGRMNHGHQHSNLSELSDQPSHIEDITNRVGIFHGNTTPVSPVKTHTNHKHNKCVQSSPQKLKHFRGNNTGMSSMSSGLANYGTENESFFNMTDMDTSIDIDTEMLGTPYTSDIDFNENDTNFGTNKESLPALNESKIKINTFSPYSDAESSDCDGGYDIHRQSTLTTISRRTSADINERHFHKKIKKEKFALPAKYDTTDTKEEETECEKEKLIMKSIYTHDGNDTNSGNENEMKNEEITPQNPADTPGKLVNDDLSKVLLKVQYINDVRQELIRRTYIFPHKCKLCVSIFIWVYIFAAFAAVIYFGTQFNASYTAIADKTELLSYTNMCENGNNITNIPIETRLNYRISSEYAHNISSAMSNTNEYSPYTDMSEKETLSNSTKWAMSVVLAVLFYILILLPFALFIATLFMIYNTFRGRTFDVNMYNVCDKFCIFDVLCCGGKSILWRKYKRNESELSMSAIKKTKKHKNDKFHGIPQNENDNISALELEISEIHKLSDDSMTHERLESFSENNEFEYKYNNHSSQSLPDSFTEFAFLCTDQIFVAPTKDEEQRLEFMNYDNTNANVRLSKPLQLKPSPIQKKISSHKHHSNNHRKKKRKRKGKKKKRKRSV